MATHEKKLRTLLEALSFYADPDTYFAIGFFPDPPCGTFMEDFSKHGSKDYPKDDVRPGKKAREALDIWYDDTPLIDPDCKATKHDSCVGGACECSCHERKE